jgi:urease accessory protein
MTPPGITRTVGAMDARARIVAVAGPGGNTVLAEVSGGGPLALRRTGPRGGAAEVYLVGAAAGPLGGDVWRLEIVVGPGATLCLRSAAATVALPGRFGAESRWEIDAEVAADGLLDLAPEPLIAAAGARHRTLARIRVADGGALLWREELVCGRDGEQPGDVSSRLSVDHDGKPLLVQDLSVGPAAAGWRSAAVLGGARAVGTLLFAGRAIDAAPPVGPLATGSGAQAAVAALAGPGVLVTAVGTDVAAVRRALNPGKFAHN